MPLWEALGRLCGAVEGEMDLVVPDLSPVSHPQPLSNHLPLWAHLCNVLYSSKQDIKYWDFFSSKSYSEDWWDYICERFQQTSNEKRCLHIRSCWIWSKTTFFSAFLSCLPLRPMTIFIHPFSQPEYRL